MYDCIVWLIVGVGLVGSVLDSGEAPGFEWRAEAMGDLGYVAMQAGLF